MFEANKGGYIREVCKQMWRRTESGGNALLKRYAQSMLHKKKKNIN